MKIERCQTCKRRLNRSTVQNRRYWSLLHELERLTIRGKTYNAETWHLWCKSKFLGCMDYVLPSGKTLVVPNTTTALDKEQFDHYMTAVEAFANGRGVYLEDKEELTS